MRWWKANERYLVERTPIANVGIVWSQRNTDFFGRDMAADVVDAPYTGFMHALVRARIPYLPVHADEIEQARGRPEGADPARTSGRCRTIRWRRSDGSCERGGSLFATGATSLFTEWGDARPDFALADLFRCHQTGELPRGSTRRFRGSDWRLCAEPERPHLSPARSRTARARRRSTSGRRTRLSGHAPRRTARIRRNGSDRVRGNAWSH